MEAEKILQTLKSLGQEEVIKRYNEASEQEKKDFIVQYNTLEKACQGGIKGYLERAKILLQNSKNNVNTYKDYTPQIPPQLFLKTEEPELYELEKFGFEHLKDTVFVLVAGGLGERLGYGGIKIALQSELITLKPFLEIYVDYIKAYEDRIKKNQKTESNWFIPLCIMTSGDTHEKTLALLKENNNFGLKKGQISIVKQEKVPAIKDHQCNLAINKDKLLIETKPHGHGDVHFVLYQSGLVKKWVEEGKRHLILFQDTNILAFNCMPSLLGSSIKLDLDMNSIGVPRRPGDAIGDICKLITKDGSSIILNVEYNQLDTFMKEKYNGKGDVANSTGFCDFPGNVNIIAIKLESYIKVLEKSKGIVPEFVNPKYTDATRTKFKSPTRLECLMQDLAKLYSSGEKIGITSYERWFCFSACKNNLSEACTKMKKNLTPEGVFSTEQSIFYFNRKIMEDVFGKLEVIKNEPENEIIINDCTIKFGPKIIIYPSFAASVSELKEKLNHMKNKIKMTINSTLVLKNDINIDEGIDLDGYLVIDKDQKEMVVVKNQDNIMYSPLKENEGKIYEKIRGYCPKKSK